MCVRVCVSECLSAAPYAFQCVDSCHLWPLRVTTHAFHYPYLEIKLISHNLLNRKVLHIIYSIFTLKYHISKHNVNTNYIKLHHTNVLQFNSLNFGWKTNQKKMWCYKQIARESLIIICYHNKEFVVLFTWEWFVFSSLLWFL